MSLRTLQSALAELFTSDDARRRYDGRPGEFCDAYDLDQRERAQLSALAENAIASYAATLVRKRRAEAARLLPQTSVALGEAFAQTFETWAARRPLGEGPSRYARDASAFCNHLLEHVKSSEQRRSIEADLSVIR